MKDGDPLLVVLPGSGAVVKALARQSIAGGDADRRHTHRWEAWSIRPGGGYVRAIWADDEWKLWAHGDSADVKAALLLARSAC